MEIVKNNTAQKSKKLEQKLKGLLYKKGMLEHLIKVAETGANISCTYAKEIENKIKLLEDENTLGLEYYKLKYDLLEVKRFASNHISDFKEFKKRYEDGVVLEIRKTVEKEDFDQMEFQDIEAMAKEMVKHELFGKVEVEPENIEHPEIIKSIDEYLEIIERLVVEIKNELSTNKNLTPLERVRLDKELYDFSIHGQTLQKRALKRKEYYSNQFLPTFKKDMEECAIKLDGYLSTAKQIAELGIDPLMSHTLSEYEKHKNEPEKLWLFYTALRSRLQSIGSYLSKHKKKNPKAVDIMAEFL